MHKQLATGIWPLVVIKLSVPLYMHFLPTQSVDSRDRLLLVVK